MIPAYLTTDRHELETVARRHCQTARLSDDVVLCRVLGKYIMYADPSDVGITPHLCLDGFWESWITLAMAREVKAGWHCVDVGANHGYYTLIMADAVGSTGRVMAVEPNPRLAALLELSLEVNGMLLWTKVVQKAANDTTGDRVRLSVPQNRGLNATICADHREKGEKAEPIDVETVAIDVATADWPRVDLVKIDAEGAEQAIWRGMEQTVKRNSGITIIMEARPGRCSDPAAFVAAIENAGFGLRHIDYDGEVKEITGPQFLHERPREDWMLFLRRE